MVEVRQGIDWYLEEPERLLKKKCFVRGGSGIHYQSNSKFEVGRNSLKRVEGSKIKYREISQDVYLSEYDPYLHAVTDMVNMPKLTVNFKNGYKFESTDVIITSGYQKVLHATQIQNLSHSPMKFSLCNVVGSEKKKGFISNIKDMLSNISQTQRDDEALFTEFQELWQFENEESRKADIYATQKSCGDVGVLFQGNEKNKEAIKRKVLRYKDDYIIIPNYDEYGDTVAVTCFYTINEGKTQCMDTYSGKEVYRFEKNLDNENSAKDYVPEWILMGGYPKKHGYSKTNLLYHRSVVAWEYVQSYITVIEMIENVIALCQKYYSTFMMAVYGNIEEDALDNLVGEIVSINITNPTGSEKVDVISFPENMSAYKYMEHLKEQIEIFSSTTLGGNKNQTNGSDSRGGAMTMKFKADIALAKHTQLDYAEFWSEYVYLLQEAFDMKYYDGKEMFRRLKIKPNPQVWTPISDSLLIDNIKIAYQAKFMSRRTAIEKCPLSERDELLRILEEDEMAFNKEVERMKSQSPEVDEEGNPIEAKNGGQVIEKKEEEVVVEEKTEK